MFHYWTDNVHTTSFTPRDFQVELLASALEKNIIVCIGQKSSKEFIALKLIQERASDIRRNNYSKKKAKKWTIYITNRNSESTYNLIHHLTDLKVYLHSPTSQGVEKADYDENQVLILSPKFFLNELEGNRINFCHVNVLIAEDCHDLENQNVLFQIFDKFYSKCPENSKPKILCLAGPLHSAGCLPTDLKGTLDIFEKKLHCEAETASDIVTVLRYCSKPTEIILECAQPPQNELIAILKEIIFTKQEFLKDHRYDPSEIYSDEFLEELQGIPDPKNEPNKFLNIYLDVLNEMGPWCADRVALNFLSQIEKQKVKTPYERHFLLLCLVSTTLVEIRSYCDYVFHKLPKEKDRIEKYSSPKVLRLLEILRCFKPETQKTENKELEKIINDIDKLDFKKLTNVLESTSQMLERNESRELRNVMENLENIVQDAQLQYSTSKEINITKSENVNISNHKIVYNDRSRKNTNNRNKRKFNPNINANGIGTESNSSYYRHKNRDNSSDPDALCGIVFCNSKNTAKVLFDLLCEMSKHDSDLGFLCVQYTVDRVADPITEPKEAELEHRRQEEVLKRFRMHDCNLLIGTSVLEEGIDLPKCNLVIRWDPPTTYRSYVQCKGRARASQACHIMLVCPNSNQISAKNSEREYDPKRETLSPYCHKLICANENRNKERKNEMENISSDHQETNKKHRIEVNNQKTLALKPISNGTKEVEKIEVITIESGHILEQTNQNNYSNENNVYIENNNDIVGEEESSDLEYSSSSSTTNRISYTKFDKNEKKSKKNKKHGFDNLNQINIISLDEAFDEISNQIQNNHLEASSKDDNSDIEDLNNVKADKEDQNLKNGESKIHHSDEFQKFNLKENTCSKLDESGTLKQFNEQKVHKCLVENVESASNHLTETNTINIENSINFVIDRLAEYREIEKILLQKCANSEPSMEHHFEAERFSSCVEPYKPLSELLTGASVDMSSAIALVNKYCAKLPSDTFTKLTPLWRKSKTTRKSHELFQYTIRLPINSPLKFDIVGLPMPSDILARRLAALLTCRELHKNGELDDNLQPIGKEGFHASEPDWENFELEENDEQIVQENSEPRPGTTKRRQYYYKRIANEFSDCRPIPGEPAYLYFIDLTLQCPIPEEQNTRGRKIYPPEDAQQGFGILTLKQIPKVSSFPIFTRSGEVKVSLKLCKEQIVLSEEQVKKINVFLNYTFTNVLRLQKFLMLFDPDATENSIFIVPTIKCKSSAQGIVIDWNFLEVICKNCDKMPTPVPEPDRKGRDFDANRFKDAVVMPWYRNQDQPQYFYVAEICYHLSPESCFPGQNYKTFQEYYFLKYNINIQNTKQPLLDVDHTSARLNFLTPRYVNRKGVALPTSSEETKRAKRENLEQKQILVPELCTIHPFPASLWRAAVCLPCILYRINGLLLADEIRKKVCKDLGLGRKEIFDENFEWPMLDFGWSLAEVLKKSRKLITEDDIKKQEEQENDILKENFEEPAKPTHNESAKEKEEKVTKSVNDILEEADEKMKADNFVEIGTWSNDMANNIESDADLEDDWGLLPSNINLCSTKNTNIRYGSPTSWVFLGENNQRDRHFSDSDVSYQSDDEFDMRSLISYSNGCNNDIEDEDESNEAGLRIEFKSNNVAEAIETEEQILKRQKQLAIIQETSENEKKYQLQKNQEIGFELELCQKQILYQSEHYLKTFEDFQNSILNFKNDICSSGVLKRHDEKFSLPKKEVLKVSNVENDLINVQKLVPYISLKKLQSYMSEKYGDFQYCNVQLKIEDIEELNRIHLLENQGEQKEKYEVLGIGDLFDNFNDLNAIQSNQGKCKNILIDFERNPNSNIFNKDEQKQCDPINDNLNIEFSFDYQPELDGHPGPSPSVILQALTMSNANDGINLERLETIGDSFLKYAITSYLYCTYENVHEGKLSHLRSKQVSNLNLYRLGRRKVLGECMIATKFEPHDNWLPPCYYVPKELEKALIEAKIPPCHWNLADLPNIKQLSSEEICELVRKKAEALDLLDDDTVEEIIASPLDKNIDDTNFTCFIPYNLVTQHSIPVNCRLC
ncbi:endoribonuclease Dcr-1 isoform X2 [Condylostylus longicornis]|uniref:endoribonuclease Dcr-1 isoform X2 n=1 Tax=Condylostylus longicornis TaxID=2530218 RepID=UPI00244DE1F6|nr:endoribonuclease Dcr-1 isoform X2 [Condylostylus longicornis]